MSYLGRGLEQVDNISKLDNITFNGGTTYALTKDSAAFTPISSNAILISIDGVVQQGNFSVSGTNIVFNFSPTSSNTCDFIMHYGTGIAFTPADSSVTKDKANFISTSSAAGLQIKGDGTTDGTLQLNCSQNSHGVKIKSPAHSAGQSYTLTLPTTAPASNKMLQTDGSGNLSFIDAPGGAFNFVAGSANDSEHSNVTIDNCFTSTYQNYLIQYSATCISGSNNTRLEFKLRTGGASGSDHTSEYRRMFFARDTQNNTDLSSGDSSSESFMHIGASAMSNSASMYVNNGQIYVHAPVKSGFQTNMFGMGNATDWNGYQQTHTYSCRVNSTTAMTGFKINANQDNLRNSHVRVYGIVDS